MILSDREIIEEVAKSGMISPFIPYLKSVENEDNPEIARKVISYGLSSYGYDIRCAADWQIFSSAYGGVIDPKQRSGDAFIHSTNSICIIPPNNFVLTRSIEYFKMPRDVMAICVGKSTLARVGIVANITPIEAGWEGNLTIELSNTTPLPVKVYGEEGIAQLLFFRGLPCKTSYADRKGKYQGTVGIVNAKV